MPESLFANPVWHALHTKHSHFAVSSGDACRYPADVAPFAAVLTPTGDAFRQVAALRQLSALLTPGESVWFIGEGHPQMPELLVEETMECIQMVLPDDLALPEPAIEILRLTDSDAPEMVALTDLAYPGFFRRRTCEMGSYYGVRSQGELIAMGGERVTLDGAPEISGVCTHPAWRGKGLATSITWQLARNHRRDGLISWLHVGSANYPAIDLYSRMGFQSVRKVMLNRVSRRG